MGFDRVERVLDWRRPGRASQLSNDPASARCRLPPTTKTACATSRRAAGVRPSNPSSPMPTKAKPAFACSRSGPLNRLRLLILGGTSEASALARRIAGEQRRHGGSLACGRDRQSCPDRRSLSALAASAAPRASPPISRRAHRRCRRRDPSVRFAHVGQRHRRVPRDRYAACRVHPTALDARAGRPLAPRGDHGRRGPGSRGRAEEPFSSRKAGGTRLLRRARRCIAMSCAPSTGRRRSTRCQTVG